MSGPDPSLAILRAIRGEDDIADAAAALGIGAAETGQRFELSIPSDVPVVTPAPGDVARGLLASWARGGAALQTWARFMLGLVDVDLGPLERHPSGELILEGIWEAAAGGEVSDQALDAARAAIG